VGRISPLRKSRGRVGIGSAGVINSRLVPTKGPTARSLPSVAGWSTTGGGVRSTRRKDSLDPSWFWKRRPLVIAREGTQRPSPA
jgi:hypothetical protein